MVLMGRIQLTLMSLLREVKCQPFMYNRKAQFWENSNIMANKVVPQRGEVGVG